MAETIIINREVFEKGRAVFTGRGDAVSWISLGESEEEVSRAVRERKARIAVLGTARYSGDLYAALAENSAGNPALIARFGVGYDGIDLALCKRNRIFLSITAGALDQSVAEHAMALLLCIARGIPRLDHEMHAGMYRPVTGFELSGSALGVAGFGKIGRRLALIAKAGFGMKIHAFDSVTIEEQAARDGLNVKHFQERYRMESYDTEFGSFARRARIVSIHMPVNEGTRDFFSRERLSSLRDGAVLVNTGRGALIDELALHDALVSGKVSAAALDVYQNEPYSPMAPESDLRKLPNVIMTPHVASNTVEANSAMADMVMDSIGFFMDHKYDLLPRVV